MVQRVFRSGMTRIKRRMADLNQAEATRGKEDIQRLSQRFPGLSDYHAQAQAVASTFRVYHMDYNERVGHPVHAASIELVVLLQLMFRELDPAKAVIWGLDSVPLYCVLWLKEASGTSRFGLLMIRKNGCTRLGIT